jgi:hypothetical protein
MADEKDFPLNHGNYFSLDAEDGKGYEIANFWYEDFDYLIRNKIIEFPVNIKVLEKKWAIISDNRVPFEFYSETSYRAPEKYWSLKDRLIRHQKIDTGIIKIFNGYETQEIKATRRMLDVKWSIEATQDLAIHNSKFDIGISQ